MFLFSVSVYVRVNIIKLSFLNSSMFHYYVRAYIISSFVPFIFPYPINGNKSFGCTFSFV